MRLPKQIWIRLKTADSVELSHMKSSFEEMTTAPFADDKQLQHMVLSVNGAIRRELNYRKYKKVMRDVHSAVQLHRA